MAPPVLRLGERTYDLAGKALVMGILNRTPDSFFDGGRYFELDDLLRRAEEMVADGADLLDVGGVKAGPGPEVSLEEEMHRVVPVVEALVARFDVPVSVDTWKAPVAREAFFAGATLGNDISGFADPDYLDVACRAGASVVATHIRLAPRVPDPEPHYDDVVGEVRSFLVERAGRALAAGLGANQVILDAGLDLGKTPEQSLRLLRESSALAELGHPLMLSASNKRFLGELLHLEPAARGAASCSAVALGVIGGCRIVRVHDVRGAQRVCRSLAALARTPEGDQAT